MGGVLEKVGLSVEGRVVHANRAALLAERSQDGVSAGSIERAEGRMAAESIRRHDMDTPAHMA